MKVLELNSIPKLYFGYEDIARVRGISHASARVTASRYVKQGALLRLKRNLYILPQVWSSASQEDKFKLANLGQTPSYISLTTALAYYEITTQIQRDFIESVALKRTRDISLNGSVFRYSKISDALYFGFGKQNDFFIAKPEKALLDAFYLMSFGRYSLDLSALDADKLDREAIRSLSSEFPASTARLLRKHGYLQTA